MPMWQKLPQVPIEITHPALCKGHPAFHPAFPMDNLIIYIVLQTAESGLHVRVEFKPKQAKLGLLLDARGIKISIHLKTGHLLSHLMTLRSSRDLDTE